MRVGECEEWEWVGEWQGFPDVCMLLAHANVCIGEVQHTQSKTCLAACSHSCHGNLFLSVMVPCAVPLLVCRVPVSSTALSGWVTSTKWQMRT